LKDLSPDALIWSLQLIALGEKVFPSNLASIIATGGAGGDGKRATGEAPSNGNLSERDVRILSCLLLGQSNKRIAQGLNLTEGAVKVHVRSVLKKINAQNRTQAAIWARDSGLRSDLRRWG
jgi:two-component system nitrate/nitrite response regulator NarL